MKLPRIERAVVEVHGGCNYSCRMCPQSAPGRAPAFRRQMPFHLFLRVLNEMADSGLGVVNLDGSGEATLAKDLPMYVETASKFAEQVLLFTNGLRFKGGLMRDCIDAGLDYVRFSVIGSDAGEYRRWMRSDAFGQVRANAEAALEYAGDRCHVASYHLVTRSRNNPMDEVAAYRRNWIEPLGISAEVWMLHNWSGVYAPPYKREGVVQTCGRPFAPELVIRAGGRHAGLTGAVHPCCQVLGRDEHAILGHASEMALADIWHGPAYDILREGHRTGNYPDCCVDCDFLLSDPEVLVWTNYDRKLHQMHRAGFSLEEYRGSTPGA